MQALATYTGYLQCWDWFDFREGGGARGTQLAIWPDRLEITTHGVSRLSLRPRTIPKDRVQLIRPLLPRHPVHQVMLGVRGLINFVVSAPKEQPISTGNIHYVLTLPLASTSGVLNACQTAGFPVSYEPLRLTRFDMGGELSYLDLMGRRRPT